MTRRMYNWTLAMAEHPRALWAFAFIAFIESSFFPIPPDILLIPLILAMPSRAFSIAFIAVTASVAGGIFGYFIGAFAFEAVGQPILSALGKIDSIAKFNETFNNYGLWAVIVAGVTPFPFKVITIMSGWSGFSFSIFVISAVVARSIRFFAVATLLYFFGAPIREFIEQRLGLLFTLIIVLLLGGIFAISFV